MSNPNQQITINWDWKKIINEKFLPLVNNRDRYLICYGGRASSKSDFVSKLLIYRCLSDPYFRFICVRKKFEWVKDSVYKQLVETIEDLGLTHLFTIYKQPLRIVCKHNGNEFLFRGADKPKSIKSIKDPTGCWFEEELVDYNDWLLITQSIRTCKAKGNLQEIFTCQPEVEGDYKKHWFYKMFFSKNEGKKAFSDMDEIEVKGKKVDITYTVHHSTYRDNKYLPPEGVAQIEATKKTNPYKYLVNSLGEWGYPKMDGLFYYNFSRIDHVSNGLFYDPDKYLHISFDFNKNPYMSCSIWQIEGKTARCIDEIIAVNPMNTTKGLCQKIARKYHYHTSGVFIYGDPSGKRQDTRTEAGYNDFRIIENELARFKPQLRVASVAPNQGARGNFVNEIFAIGVDGISVIIGENCNYLITDLMNQKQDSDGTKHKQKEEVNGVKQEKYGHLSDSMDYFLCEAFKNEYIEHKDGAKKANPIFGTKRLNRKTSY